MIPIRRDNLDELAKKHYEHLKAYILQSDTKYDFDALNCDLIFLLNKDFEELVLLTPMEQYNLIRKLQSTTYSKTISQLKNLYEVFRNKWAYWLMSELNISVCPYCNREYIFRFEDSQKEDIEKLRVIASFDHFYDKNTYPFLAVSFFNLIPCCHLCNSKFKHSKNFFEIEHLHPYIDNFNEKARFKLKINDSGFYRKKESIELEIKILKEQEKTQNTIRTFRLEELYQNHKDIIIELIQKEYIYNDSYIDEIFKQYEGTLFKNREDVLRSVTGGYMDDKDLDKRPLSKLIKDISEELGLI